MRLSEMESVPHLQRVTTEEVVTTSPQRTLELVPKEILIR